MLLFLIFALIESFEAVFDLINIFLYTARGVENFEDSINEEQDGIWSMLPSFKFPPGNWSKSRKRHISEIF